MKEAVDELNTTLEEAASEFGIVSGMVDNITKAIGKVSHLLDPAGTLVQILIRDIFLVLSSRTKSQIGHGFYHSRNRVKFQICLCSVTIFMHEGVSDLS